MRVRNGSREIVDSGLFLGIIVHFTAYLISCSTLLATYSTVHWLFEGTNNRQKVDENNSR